MGLLCGSSIERAEGNRVEDTTPNRLFWYGASGNLLETTDAGTTNHDYIYFAGRRIARHDSSGAVYYLYDDANGSLRTATDASGTQLCWADYYPFGEPVAGTGCSVDNYQFAGLYADATGEDGNYSAAHRRYNYSYYRWLSPDPDNAGASVTDSQSWDMYSYTGDNPISRDDPSGQSYCKKGSNDSIDLSTCVSDKAYKSLKDTTGYLHVSRDTSITVNGGGATHNDYMFALGAGVHMAAPVVNATNQGLRGFGYIVAPLPMAAADYLAGAPGSGKVSMGLAILPDAFAFSEIAKIAQGLKPTAEGVELQAVINELYDDRDVLPGGTAGAVRHELATGESVGGRWHSIKAGERMRQLNRLISSGKLSPNDTAIARALVHDLGDALAGK